MTIIKMKELSPSAMSTYSKLQRANLVAIDDIMLLPVRKEDASGFFNFINQLHEKASVIITTNKAPTEWAETLMIRSSPQPFLIVCCIDVRS